MAKNPLEQLHVLVVEDVANMQVLIKMILHGLGVGKISLASDGAEGVQVLQTQHIDIVFCDIKMEVLDGLEMVKMIRTAMDSPNPYVPIIMVTGCTKLADVVAARNAGATEFLAKPISAAAIYSRIAHVINHPRPFVRLKDYCGPDRRREVSEMYIADDRRTGPEAITENISLPGGGANPAGSAEFHDKNKVSERVAGRR